MFASDSPTFADLASLIVGAEIEVQRLIWRDPNPVSLCQQAPSVRL
jgi:hypothetical protein